MVRRQAQGWCPAASALPPAASSDHHRSARCHHRHTRYFNCSTYTLTIQREKPLCCSHYINNDALNELLLETIRTVSKYALTNEEEFIRKIRSATEVQQAEEAKALQRSITKAKKRSTELDVLIKRLYESYALEKIPEKRYETLSAEYEQEQTELEATIAQDQANEPVFSSDILIYDSKSYVIGQGHIEFTADKMLDQDYYLLTLAAIARKLHIRNLTTARVVLAVGLPLTWVSAQKESFKAYLMQKPAADFTFRDVAYHVEFTGCEVFPQGFSAVAAQLRDFSGINMLCDIGNGTMNVMFINDRKPVPQRCFTEKYGVHQCVLAIRENLMRTHGVTIDEAMIERILRTGKAEVGEKYMTVIRQTAEEYIGGILRKLREHEYNSDLVKLYIMGGGSCMVRQFGKYDPARVSFNHDMLKL